MAALVLRRLRRKLQQLRDDYDDLTTGYGNALDRLVAKAKRHQVDCLLLTDWAPVHRHKSEPTEPQRRRGALRKWYSW